LVGRNADQIDLAEHAYADAGRESRGGLMLTSSA
jgi:hypothetical protein